MRKDIVHYFEARIDRVFNAYREAAFQKFGKDSQAQPFHTVSFGLNYSLKYNMTGGSCNVHLIPYNTGTAVDVRYAVAQLAGARCGAYDAELTKYVCQILGIQAQKLELGIDTFLDPRNQVTSVPGAQPAMRAAAQAPASAAVSAPAAAPAPARRALFCKTCGARLEPGDVFCGSCGRRI